MDPIVSSYCAHGGCVAVEFLHGTHVRIFDTNDALNDAVFTNEEYRAFLLGAKGGEFDLPD